ncbi:MAG TPA: hypothetical protein VNJ08_06340 [Bacteriovoracaceae bacterium]|nr:hypothetical protein [Bacteriovoracaceae bacterium]
MKQAFLFFFMMMGIHESFACSMSVNENYTKNSAVSHVASFHDLSLLSASGITLTNYALSYEGGAGIGSCPDYMIVSARVSMASKNCTYSGYRLPRKIPLRFKKPIIIG